VTNNETLTVRDNRTGQEYEIPITDGTVRAADLGQIGKTADDHGIAVYDPASPTPLPPEVP
jgi:citrate synthase